MRFKVLLLPLFCLALWPVMSRSADGRRKVAFAGFKLKDGPGQFGPLIVSDQNTFISVQVPVEDRLQAPPGTRDTRPAPDVAKLGLQVWLLKADGSIVSQQSAGTSAGMIGGLGAENWFVTFDFAKVPLTEVTGIVFRREGKLYSQPIAAADWRTQ